MKIRINLLHNPVETLEDNSKDNVHIMHKSLTVLLLKGLIAWLMIAVIYLIGGVFISGTNSLSGQNTAILQAVNAFWPSVTVSIIVLFLYGALILYITLDWIMNYYILDSKVLVTKHGIIFTKEIGYDLGGLESMEVTQGLFGQLFNFGTLVLTNPLLDKKLKLRYIPDPYTEAQFIHRMHPNPDILHFLPKK